MAKEAELSLNWLHLYWSGTEKKRTYSVRRTGSSRPLVMLQSANYAKEYAIYFAYKHSLLLFIHGHDGAIVHTLDCRNHTMHPSKDFKTYYNEEMKKKLLVACPNLEASPHIAEIKVRSRFKGKEEPDFIVVHIKMKAGQRLRFKEVQYLFPTEQLQAKIGLLL